MTEVKFHDPLYIPDARITYAVVAARVGNNWLFVRHHKRDTWEIAGGHIEKNETSGDAAERELREETGATEFTIECIATYSVVKDGLTGFGRLYLSEISKPGPLPDASEIAEVKMMDSLPGNLTYPDIQPVLFSRILSHLEQTRNT